MNRQPSKDLLRRLAMAPGPAGAEDEIRRIVRETLADTGTVSYDRTGSILCELSGPDAGPRIVVDSHLDEVGFLVQSIGSEGMLSLAPLGGWWGHVLLGQRVDILTESGVVPGVIGSKPPHFLSAAERDRVLNLDQMYVDVGASGAETVHELGIRVGDPVAPHGEFVEFGVPGVLSCKALDNRVGVGLMCETLLALRGDVLRVSVIGVGSVQEELGCRGARTSSFVAEPDVALILEATPADDTPGFTSHQARLGAGPQIRMFDPTAVANRRLVRLLQSVAADAGIEIQIAVRTTGGTDAKEIHLHGRGVPSVVIGVPARYIHTHVSLIRWDDYCAAQELVLALLRVLDADAIRRLIEFG